jgi:hypothetical protein
MAFLPLKKVRENAFEVQIRYKMERFIRHKPSPTDGTAEYENSVKPTFAVLYAINGDG